MPKSTLALNKNIETRKKLVGIANFITRNSEARFLSRGTSILTTEQEIRDTKKAQVLIPLLQGVMDVIELLAQAKGGGIKSEEIQLNEFIVELANEKVTKPIIYRPRDGEVINASSILQRMSASFNLTSTLAKDKAYYQNILAQGKAGVDIAVGAIQGQPKLKAEIVESKLDVTDANNDTGEKVKNNATVFGSQLRRVRARIKRHKDRFFQSKIKNSDIAIVISTDGELVLENDARYNMYTEKAVNMNGALDLEIDGQFDGSPVLVSKQLPDGVDFIVMVFGSATSLFAIRNKLNMDKVVGLEAYITTLEFDEGTGVWLPHLITIGTSDTATHPVQSAVGFEAYEIAMNNSQTNSGNKTGSAGLPAPGATDSLVGDDLDGDGTIQDGELATFDATKWFSANYAQDKTELTPGQKRALKKALGVANNANDGAVQSALTADKANRV